MFQAKCAAYLNLIDLWWKVLRSRALKGRHFEAWEEVCRAIEAATAYWKKHRHPIISRKRRRRHADRRSQGRQSPGRQETCRMDHLDHGLRARGFILAAEGRADDLRLPRPIKHP